MKQPALDPAGAYRRELKNLAGDQLLAAFRELSPETMRRLNRYQELDDPAVDPIVLLPDLGPDTGLPVGTTLMTQETLLPYAIGMDPGCGYGCWVLKGARSRIDRRILQQWVETAPWGPAVAEAAIVLPVVLGNQSFAGTALEPLGLPFPCIPPFPALPTTLQRLSDRVLGELTPLIIAQVGTLATGNHFLELHAVQDPAATCDLAADDLVLIVHNGSSAVGARVQTYGLRLAAAGTAAITPELLPFLALRAHTPAGAAYLLWLQWAVRFAAANRTVLAARGLHFLSMAIGKVTVFPLSDCIHSAISVVDPHCAARYRHQSGAQALEPTGVTAFVAGTAGGPGFLVKAAENLMSSYGTISHGSGPGTGDTPVVVGDQVVSNVPGQKLRTLQQHFRDPTPTIQLLAQARLATPVARTHPLAVIKF